MAGLISRNLQSHFAATPPWIFAATPFSCMPKLFSTLAVDGEPPLQTPFALFAAAKFKLSSADISRMLNKTPSLNTLKTLDNMERVFHILLENGCTQNQIEQIMMKQPGLLTLSAEKILEPKLHLLKDYGIKGQLLAKVLNRVPSILGTNLERCLLPNIAFLKNVFNSPDSLVEAVARCPFILIFNQERVLKPFIAFWEGCGLSGDELSKFLSGNPMLMAFSSLTPAHTDLIHKIDIPQGKKVYKSAVRIIATSRMETLEAKIQNLERCGLSTEETLILIRRNPRLLGSSQEKIREKMDLIVNQMELPANIVVKSSSLLGSSLEKVIKPRFLVLQKIKSMKGVENLKPKPLLTVLLMTKSRFLRSIIEKHPESSTLYDLYQDAVANVSASEKIGRKGFPFLRVLVVSGLKEH